ncbi:MAG: amidohydrolase family protein, partial [Acidimicrobiia bacterium]
VTTAPPVRSMIDLDIPVAAGSDGTVACAYNPWRGVSWLVTGDSIDGTPPRVEGQRLTRDEALRLYTTAGAWFSSEDATRGNLRRGSHADLTVLSQDPLRIAAEGISEIESVLTVVGGEPVHSTL